MPRWPKAFGGQARRTTTCSTSLSERYTPIDDNIAVAHGCRRVAQELTVLARRYLVPPNRERIERYGVDWHFIVPVLDPTQARVVSHLKRAGRNRLKYHRRTARRIPG